MADNRDTGATWTFHDASKYVAVRDEAGEEQFMMGTPPNVQNPIWQEDWSIEPFPFKVYETLDALALPREELAPLSMPALDAIAATGDEPSGNAQPSLADLARICLLSNGILKRGGHRPGGQEILYRAAGGTGARYHLELYIACGDLDGLAAGVYHYSAQDHSLRRLRAGDFRNVLVDATGAEPSIAAAPAVLLMTSTFWRNAWRYKARAYRHTFWDAGTTFSNILSVAAGEGLPTRVVLGYADAQVNALLDVDGEREAVVALCAIGRDGVQDSISAHSPQPSALGLPFRAPSEREVVFPEIAPMHHASELASGAEAAAWRANPLRRTMPEPRGPVIPLRPLPADRIPPDPIDATIRRRRSTRHFASETPISFEAFSTLLDRSTRGFAADCLAPGALPLHDEYLIVYNVEELEQGIYVLHPDRKAIELLKAGNFRQHAKRLAVEQEYAADAHVNIYYLTDLRPVLEHYGNRGYRLAQLECALYASKLHLGTHALGLGAVGSTSFDDEVTDFFSPHAAGKSFMFVITFGLRRRKGGA
jgi:SagB-type dehydrogenase family enzyme